MANRNSTSTDSGQPRETRDRDRPFPERRILFALASPLRSGFLVALGVGLTLLLFQITLNISQLLTWLLTALFIALGLDPVVRFFEHRGVPRGAGVAVTFFGLVALVLSFISSIVPPLIEQTSALVSQIPPWSEDVLSSEWFKSLDGNWHLKTRIEDELNKIFNNNEIWTNTANNVLAVGQTIGNVLFGTTIVLILSLYFLSALPAAKEWAYLLAPASRRSKVKRLSEQIARTVGNYVIGQIAVAAIQGLMAFTLLTIVGAPYAALVAFTVALLAFIPMIGGFMACILVGLVSLTQGLATTSIVLIIYIVYLQVEANWLSPKIMAKAVNVPAAVAVIAVIAGGSLLGILGALIAIPVAASVMLLIREIWLPHQNKR